MKELKVVRANYLVDYLIEIEFSDETKQVVNFEEFLTNSHNPQIRKYLDLTEFKNFKIIDGDLNWNDFDLIFPVLDLYNNKV